MLRSLFTAYHNIDRKYWHLRRHYQSNHHIVTSITAALNWCGNRLIRGGSPAAPNTCSTLGRRHQHVAQFCRNIQTSFSMCLCIQKVCLVYSRIHKNVIKKYFFKSKNSEKNNIMICGMYYFITKLKTKIDVIPRSCFNILANHM